MSRLMARIEKMIICVSNPTQYELRNAGAARSSTARGIRTGRAGARAVLGPAIETGRLDGEHDHHRGKEREVRQLGNQRLAEVVDEADDDAAGKRPFEAP